MAASTSASGMDNYCDENEERSIEFCLHAYLKYISQSIDWNNLVLDYPLFTPEQKQQFNEMGKARPQDVTIECLNTILYFIHVPGKFRALIEAMEKAKNTKVISILKGEVVPTNEINKQRVYSREICEQLNALEVVDYLCAKGVIDDRGKQEVWQKGNNEGKVAATQTLLFMIHKTNIHWFQHFLETLYTCNYKGLVKLLDSDIFKQLEANQMRMSNGDCPPISIVDGYKSCKPPLDPVETAVCLVDKRKEKTDESLQASPKSMNSLENDLRSNCHLSDSLSYDMLDLVDDSVRLTIINTEATPSSPVHNVSEKSTPTVGKLTALNIDKGIVVTLQVYDNAKMHLLATGNTVLLFNYAVNNDDMIITHKTDVHPIEIGNKHATKSRQKEKETSKTTDRMSVSEEASKATACISVSEAACLRKKTVCTVKGIVTKVDAQAFLTNLDISRILAYDGCSISKMLKAGMKITKEEEGKVSFRYIVLTDTNSELALPVYLYRELALVSLKHGQVIQLSHFSVIHPDGAESHLAHSATALTNYVEQTDASIKVLFEVPDLLRSRDKLSSYNPRNVMLQKQPMSLAEAGSASDDAEKKDKSSVAVRNAVTHSHSQNSVCHSNTSIKGRSKSNWKHGVSKMYTVLRINTLDSYRSCTREECKRKKINETNNKCPVCKTVYSCTEEIIYQRNTTYSLSANTTYSLSAKGKVTLKKLDDSDKPRSYMIFTHQLEELCAFVGVKMDLDKIQATQANILETLPVTLELEINGTVISTIIRKIG